MDVVKQPDLLPSTVVYKLIPFPPKIEMVIIRGAAYVSVRTANSCSLRGSSCALLSFLGLFWIPTQCLEGTVTNSKTFKSQFSY